MHDIFTVIKFTMKDMLKRKSFIISTIIVLVVIVLGINAPNIINSVMGDINNNKLILVDEQNVFDGQLETLNNAGLKYEIEVSNNSYDEIKEKLDRGDISSAIIIEKQSDGTAKIRYIVENTATVAGFPKDLIDNLNSLYTNIQIQKLNLSDKQLQTLTPNFEFSLEQTQDETIHGDIFLMMILSILLFFAIYFCAFQVSSSITTEKTSKIMETLVTSTTPTTIVLGKTIGIGLVGLLQMTLFVVTAIISAKLFLDPEILNNLLDLSNITPYLGFIAILYFILGYFAYAMLYALTGSTVSKPEDIQSANTPVAILTIIGFYLAYFSISNPTSDLNAFASLFPLSSPFCMPLRVMMGVASGWDVVISLLILLVTIAIIARIAIKIYSNAILNYGTKMSFKDIIKTYKERS